MTEVVTTAEVLQPFVESDPNAGAGVLQGRMDDYGYLFFRRLLPADMVLEVRRHVLELCAAAGWLDPVRDLMGAVVAPTMQPTTEGKLEYMAVYRKVLRLPCFHAFPCDPALMIVASKLLGSDVLVHPRRIGRLTFPNNTIATTPPHQDHYYIRGSVETYSCWTPLGACPMSLGGLAVWPGSQKRGFIDHNVESPGAVGGCGVEVDPTKAVWHTGDFEVGDALFFHSYTIHKALPNLSGDRLRISTDNRYQRRDDRIDPGALRPHYDLD
ncbi:MAG: phytanoyl-CoA dioxygenase family protein [Herpetosiphonaceae bacterium]|nr:phytanoyl-CoA dioxygenase family protein [Herpetosiphonaceae bacterium]